MGLIPEKYTWKAKLKMIWQILIGEKSKCSCGESSNHVTVIEIKTMCNNCSNKYLVERVKRACASENLFDEDDDA